MIRGPRRDLSKEEAHKRAIEDYSQSTQYARNSAQFAFVGNGGAAAAILSFLASIVTSANLNSAVETTRLVRSFAVASSRYLAGMFVATAAMYLFYQAKQNWGHFWEDTAQVGSIDFSSDFARRGERFDLQGAIVLGISALLFVVGSFFAVMGFLR